MKKIIIAMMVAVMAFASCSDKPLDNGNDNGNDGIENPDPEQKPEHKPGENLENPDIPGTTDITVKDFLEASPSDSKWYKLKGIVRSLENDEFGDFFLEDETGKVYVYGLTTDNYTNGFKIRKNSKTFSQTNIKEGDFVILVGTRTYFKKTEISKQQQVSGPAYYIAHEAVKPDEIKPDEGNGGGDEGNGEILPPEESTFDMPWAELPAILDKDHNGINDKNPDYYYASHMCAGPEKDNKGRKARNFTVCYSADNVCPMWVAAPRHSMYVGEASRTNTYHQDPQIPSEIQYSNKNTGGGCNKGHMLGSHERTFSSASNRQVFYFSNIAPQDSGSHNTGGGAWNNLEDKVDTYDCKDTLYQVVGCYFNEYTDAYGNVARPKRINFGGRNDSSWPTMMYIALLRTKSGSSGKAVTECSANELQCVAFVISHEQQKGHKPQKKDMMTITELEKITGFSYFVNVPNAPKGTFNAKDWDILQ